MIFTGIGLWPAIALAAGSLGAVTLLHFLRVRPRELRVVTTLFWTHATGQTRARTLFERFRHPATFALLLAFCFLLVAALARPELTGADARRLHEVIVIDAGMSMGGRDAPGSPSRFEAARAAAIQEAERLSSRDQLALIVVDPLPRLVHRFEEPIPFVRRQLARMEPSIRPPATEFALELAASLLRGRSSPRAVWITDRAVEPSYSGDAFDLRVVRVDRPADNAALLAAMFEPDPDDPLRGRFAARVGYWGRAPRDISLRVNRGGGAPLLNETRLFEPDSTAEFSVPDLSADGDELIVELGPEDSLSADDRLAFQLPLRTPIRVGGDDRVPNTLRIAIAADPAARWVGDADERDIDVVVGSVLSGTTRPAVILNDDGPAIATGIPVTVAATSPLTKGLDLENATCGAGTALGEPDSEMQALLTAGDACVAAMTTTGKHSPPRLFLSSALVAPDADVFRRPAFAILVARAVRKLAGWDDDSVVLPPERSVDDPLWAHRADDTSLVGIAPGSRLASNLVPADAIQRPPLAGSDRWSAPALFEWFLILGIAIFGVEAVLHTRGRIS